MDDSDAKGSLFSNFDQSLSDEPSKLKAFLELEKCLDVLDADSWKFLKAEVKPYLNIRHINRGWQQLFDVINHIYAYSYLKDAGHTDIAFVPRSAKNGEKSPDIKAVKSDSSVLCEVKTINRSDDVVNNLVKPTARSIVPHLKTGFYSKLDSDIETARKQLRSYDPYNKSKHMIYINVLFDDWVGDYVGEYMIQIKNHLARKENNDISIVIQPFIFFKPAYDKRLIYCHLTTG